MALPNKKKSYPFKKTFVWLNVPIMYNFYFCSGWFIQDLITVIEFIDIFVYSGIVNFFYKAQ